MKNRKKFLQKFIAVVRFLFVFLFFSAYCIYLFERSVQPDVFDSMPAAIWYVFLTCFTVGYSDISPITLGGKFMSIVIATIGNLIGIACLIGLFWGTLRIGTFLRSTRVNLSKK